MAQHYSFPTLDTQEILDVFAELQIPLSNETLVKPPSGFMRDLYERILFMLAGIRREELTTRSFSGAQHLDDAGIHDDSIPELQFFRELSTLMGIVGITDFSRRDVDKPVKERTVRILSAVINFAKFRLDKMDQIDQYEEMLETQLEDRQALTEKNTQMALAIEKIESARAEERPQVEELEREVYELELKMKLHRKQGEQNTEIQKLKIQTAEQQDAVESKKLSIVNQRQENSKLSMQVVRSPDKLKTQLAEMQAQLDNETEAVNDAATRSRGIASKRETLSDLTEELKKCAASMEEVAAEISKAENEKQQIKEVRARTQRSNEQLKECDAQEQHLKREAELLNERIARLDNQKMQKHSQAEKELEMVKEDQHALETEIVAAKERLAEGEKYAQAMKNKTNTMQSKHDGEIAAMKEQVSMMAAELNEFHRRMRNTMSQTA